MVDTICEYGLYWLGNEGCKYVCWWSSCESSCETLTSCLSSGVCGWYAARDVCYWASFC